VFCAVFLEIAGGLSSSDDVTDAYLPSLQWNWQCRSPKSLGHRANFGYSQTNTRCGGVSARFGYVDEKEHVQIARSDLSFDCVSERSRPSPLFFLRW